MLKRDSDIWNGHPMDGFEELYEDMRRQIEDLMRRSGNLPITSQPFEYTYTKVIGADGIPHITERIGDVNAEDDALLLNDEGLEPLVDIWENETTVTILVELPGINKDDVQMEVIGRDLRLSLDTENKIFSKEIELPCKVRPSSIKTSYRGSVLEIILQKPAPRKKKERAPSSY